MKNNRKLLIIVVTVLLVIVAACGNSTDSSNGSTDNESKNDKSTQKSGADISNKDDIEKASGSDHTNEKVDMSQKDASENMESTKEKYLQKWEEMKNKVAEMRKNPLDDTTFALKKVEGDAYELLDDLLNEIYGVLEKQLNKEEMNQLRKEQREWLINRENIAKKESLKYEGGTLEQYEYVRTINNLTEKRCFELIENYMK
ncbi:lysozyme inhibitor LprI family protein [Fictibacillus phosphorivorans]|uniref:lysozyme inhibitor LprI family protein n=1 Tax=Fictibacillus phosphorivorans TaxID=1221500 RepID=UPI003CEB5D11